MTFMRAKKATKKAGRPAIYKCIQFSINVAGNGSKPNESQ